MAMTEQHVIDMIDELGLEGVVIMLYQEVIELRAKLNEMEWTLNGYYD